VSIGALDVHARVAAGGTAASTEDFRRDLATRRLELEVAAAQIVAPEGSFATLRAGVTGTAAQHAATFALKGDDVDVRMTGHGALDVPRDATGAISMAALAWKGTLDTLENQGPWTLRLAAPAAVEVARTRIHVGATRLDIADGNVQLTDFAWDDGKVTTSGSFKAVRLTTPRVLARTTLLFGSTVALGGEWSLAAALALSGTLTLRRESGTSRSSGPTADATIAAGITTLDGTHDLPTMRSTRRHRSSRAAATRPRRSSPSAPWRALLPVALRETRRSILRRRETFLRSPSCSRGSAASPWSRDACISTSRRGALLRRRRFRAPSPARACGSTRRNTASTSRTGVSSRARPTIASSSTT
jgi:hypothetical protein